MNDLFSELRRFRKQIIKSLREIKLDQNDPLVAHETIVSNATYAPWRNDNDFLNVFAKAEPNSLVDIYRAHCLWSLVRQTNQVNGNILEVGVWKGGTAAVIGVAAKGIGQLLVADTFKGVVKAGSNDTIYRGTEHADTTEKEVVTLLKSCSIKNYSILTGIFPDDFLETTSTMAFRFCHIDVDVYQSGKDVFDFVWPRLSVNGVVVFDDYGFWGCEGITKMVNEISISNGIKIHNLNGQAIIVKVSS